LESVRCRQIGTGQEIHGSYSHRSSVEGGDSGMVRSKGVSFFLREGRGLSFIVSGFTHSCYQDAVQSLLRILKTRKNFFTRMVLFAGKTSKCEIFNVNSLLNFVSKMIAAIYKIVTAHCVWFGT